MEESSEKKRRGRPRVWHGIDKIRSLHLCEAKTDRGIQEFLWSAKPLQYLKKAQAKDPAGMAWVAFYTDGAQVFHRAILSALGRLQDEAAILEWAKTIAENKTPTSRAVAVLRQVRTGKQTEPRMLTLLLCIEQAVNHYIHGHPTTTQEMIVKALRDYADGLADEEED